MFLKGLSQSVRIIAKGFKLSLTPNIEFPVCNIYSTTYIALGFLKVYSSKLKQNPFHYNLLGDGWGGGVENGRT